MPHVELPVRRLTDRVVEQLWRMRRAGDRAATGPRGRPQVATSAGRAA